MIEINNLTTASVDEDFLKKICQEVLRGEKKENKDLSTQAEALNALSARRSVEMNTKCSLSIALVGQGRMRKINKRYRGKNRITDVLAFPESRVLLEKFKVGPVQKTQQLGEIIICFREVKKNAKKYNTTFEKELARVLIHGLLHLLGYDHEKSETESEKMRRKEESYILNFYHGKN